MTYGSNGMPTFSFLRCESFKWAGGPLQNGMMAYYAGSGMYGDPCYGSPCSAGHYLSGSSCLACAAGTFSSSGSSSCSPCAAGTFSYAGSGSCSSCPTGSSSEGGSAGVSYQYLSSNDAGGNDLNGGGGQVVSGPNACASLCYATSSCVGFVMATGADNLPLNNCWIKSSITNSGPSNARALYRVTCTPSPSPPPFPPNPPFPSSSGTSCRDILSRSPGSSTGWYYISTSQVGSLKVWCDMTTDGGAAYTMFACINCVSVSTTTDTNGCAAYGLSMIVPRTKNHWTSMISFVTSTLGGSVGSYFAAIPGISKPSYGLTSCNGGGSYGIMNSAFCSGVADSWRAIDGGTWWLRDTGYSEPNGNYNANCLLGFYPISDVSNIQFDDNYCNVFTGPQYLCSTNDDIPLPVPYSFVGCYVDILSRVIPNVISSANPAMTVELCALLASQHGYSVFGLQDGNCE